MHAPINPDRPECDITRTQVMDNLFQVPQQERDEAWQKIFCEEVQTASFACGNPQVISGPDGFPYFVLKIPEPNTPFESFCIRNMKDDFLLERGLGVVINPTAHSADWVFSYGDIVNLHLNKEFFTKTDDIHLQNKETLQQDEKVLIAQPSESYLPRSARRVLRAFLEGTGIQEPKILMLCRTIEGQVVQELAFNVYPEDFSSTEQLNYRLQQISWFLPRHYIVLSLSKKSVPASGFDNL